MCQSRTALGSVLRGHFREANQMRYKLGCYIERHRLLEGKRHPANRFLLPLTSASRGVRTVYPEAVSKRVAPKTPTLSFLLYRTILGLGSDDNALQPGSKARSDSPLHALRAHWVESYVS